MVGIEKEVRHVLTVKNPSDKLASDGAQYSEEVRSTPNPTLLSLCFGFGDRRGVRVVVWQLGPWRSPPTDQ